MEKVWPVDLNGIYSVTRLTTPHLKKSSAGIIINISSVVGMFGYENRNFYSTAEWDIIGTTKTLSIELADAVFSLPMLQK